MARHMQPHTLASVMYPGLPMAMYGGNPGLSPMMHVPTSSVAPPSIEQEKLSPPLQASQEDRDCNYVQQLQSEFKCNIHA